MLALQYGRGSVFHLLLGHVWPHDFNAGYRGYLMVALENAGFRASLIRGAEWAAAASARARAAGRSS